MASQLPLETVKEILELSGWAKDDDYDDDDAHRPTEADKCTQYATCCLLNRAWCAIFRPRLYRSPALRSAEYYVRSLSRTLKANSTLAAQVRSLDISQGFGRETPSYANEDDGDLVLVLVRQCPYLEELWVNNIPVDITLLLWTSPQLKYLHFDDCTIYQDYVYLPAIESKLEVLLLRNGSAFAALPPTSPAPAISLPHFRYLSIHDSSLQDFPFLESLRQITHFDFQKTLLDSLDPHWIQTLRSCTKITHLRTDDWIVEFPIPDPTPSPDPLSFPTPIPIPTPTPLLPPAPTAPAAAPPPPPPPPTPIPTIVSHLKKCKFQSLKLTHLNPHPDSLDSSIRLKDLFDSALPSLRNLEELKFSPYPWRHFPSAEKEVWEKMRKECEMREVGFGGTFDRELLFPECRFYLAGVPCSD